MNGRCPECGCRDCQCPSELIARIEALEAALRQAREALETYECHPEGAEEAVATINAVLSGAPVKELSDEAILAIAHMTGPVAAERKRLIAFARAVRGETK